MLFRSNIKNTSPNSDEIDLIALFKTLWAGRQKIIKYTFIGTVLGLVMAIMTPKEFTSNTIMVPSVNDGSSKLGGMSGLGGLAAMAGINLNATSGGDISPLVYPKIVSSVPFMLELMKTEINFKEFSKPVTVYDYYTELQKPNLFLKYTLGLPGVIIGFFKGDEKENEKENITEGDNLNPIELTAKQKNVYLILKGNVALEADPKEGVITLRASMPEALAAAQLGQRAQLLLQKYITEFKIRKSKAVLDFIQQRVDETSKKFEDAQQRLASFRDRNKNVSLATAKAEEERLTSQYNLIYGVYSELSKQLEQSKIQVKQETPVFTIIEPISVPTKKSKPNRPLILIMGIFLGGLIGTVMIFGKDFMKDIRTKWNEEK